MRPSVAFSFGGQHIVIDVTPDFRAQALRARLPRLDAVFLTHAHADHIMGLDDIRPFNFIQSGAIPIYGSEETLAAVQRCFPYIFDPGKSDSWVPKITVNPLSGEPFEFLGREFTPIRLLHGRMHVFGYRTGNAAYLTDHSVIPEESLEKLGGLDVLFLDALRYKPHPTHTTIEQALKYVERLQPRRAFFTHVGHDISHARAESMLPAHVRFAYDGLEIEVAEN